MLLNLILDISIFLNINLDRVRHLGNLCSVRGGVKEAYSISTGNFVNLQILVIVFYGVTTVEASTERATHPSSLLIATRGLNQTQKLLPPQGTTLLNIF